MLYAGAMSQMNAIIFAAALTALPAQAEEQGPPSMMERGLQQFLEGLLLEAEPALEGLSDFMAQMGPALTDLMRQVEDWSVYEAPEILDNGDIIIRRKPAAPEIPKPEDDETMPPSIDL
ncbi:hypothetical protein [uncultured Roseobacter sp.]|uniref:hypothetical protein n=1 Tax=uncultured Roseobacter sp. TaxID=114847 RepID=UPI00261CC6B6|nr:hypothetical protein [uncultured Roseobacter sp.]